MSEEKKEEKKEVKIEELQKKIEELEKQKNEYLAGWQRARADLLNYKKEEMERIGQLINYAKEELILDILPILDNFETAEREVRSMKYEDTKTKEAIKGFLQIKEQILDFLKSHDVEEIKSVGDKFDPNFHEAVEDVPSEAKATEGVEEKDKESGIILEEIQKGYKINGRLLRPAKVRVVK